MKAFALLSLLLTSFAYATDYPAEHCEIWVDKVNLQYGYHSGHGHERSLSLFLKVDLNKLNQHGGVYTVKFVGVENVYSREGRKLISKNDFSRSLGEFFSEDYFQVFMTQLEPVWFRDTYSEYVGSFYVEASDGTRFWANARRRGGHFHFDGAGLDGLLALDQWTGYRVLTLAAGYSSNTETRNWGVDRLKKTAEFPYDYAQYYNYGNCR